MADLDDFFAKKDRKKSKSVKKFATADELGKKIDDPKQKTEARPKKERPQQEGEEGGRVGEEEEWKEYEEPVKDYTGLKLQVLQGGNGQPDTGRDSASEDSAPDNGKVKGPWNKPSEPEQPPPPPPAVVVKAEKPATYVPPVARTQRPVEQPLRRNQAKHVPDVHNDDNFPVLGAARGAARGSWSTQGAAGAGAGAGVGAGRQPLALGNRFNELRDDS